MKEDDSWKALGIEPRTELRAPYILVAIIIIIIIAAIVIIAILGFSCIRAAYQ